MFIYYNANPGGRQDGNDCTVNAICKISGLSWETVYNDLCARGRTVYAMPVSNSVWGALLYALGFRRVPVPDMCPACYTVSRWAAQHPFSTAILQTDQHVTAVVNGDWYDIADSGGQNVLFAWERMI